MLCNVYSVHKVHGRRKTRLINNPNTSCISVIVDGTTRLRGPHSQIPFGCLDDMSDRVKNAGN
jgi:hypothetical protein